ncbi:MAG: hypothetical protein AAGF07_02170 [Patescibacteria group bacterium]
MESPSQPKSKSDVASRLAILQSGYRNFVSTIRLPIAADTKWLLEVVCLHSQPNQIPASASIYDKADNFLKSYLWQHQLNMNKQRKDWIQSLKNTT